MIQDFTPPSPCAAARSKNRLAPRAHVNDVVRVVDQGTRAGERLRLCLLSFDFQVTTLLILAAQIALHPQGLFGALMLCVVLLLIVRLVLWFILCGLSVCLSIVFV